MLRFLPLIVRNCWRNRRRTTLTVLSVGVSLCLLGVLLAIYQALFHGETAPEQALRLVTRNRISLAVPMPEFYRDRIRKISGVREVGISQWFGGVYKDARDPNNFFARFAVEPETVFTLRGEMSLPEDQRRAFLAERASCMVGRGLAERLNFRLGDRITLQGDIFPVNLELTVRAIYDAPQNNENLYFHREYLEESLPAERRGTAGTFSILAESPEAVPRVAAAVDEAFRNATAQTRTESERAFELSFVSMLGNIKLYLLSICAAVTFTILLVSANTIAMSVRERVREVGVLRTLGFTPARVMSVILAEAVLISLAGGALGYGLAWLVCGIVRQGPNFFDATRNLSVTPEVAGICLAVAAVVGLLSASLPAWTTSRIPIVEALRSSD
jgi:putative ABC transport system permease protein